MSNDEIKLWNYIDGISSAIERLQVEQRLATDSTFYAIYKNLKALNSVLVEDIDLDEPSMAFTRNVMNEIKYASAPISLKTKTDKRIIAVIGLLFILMLSGLMFYAFTKANYDSATSFASGIEIESFETLLASNTALYIFLLFDVILLLVCLDKYLRKRLAA